MVAPGASYLLGLGTGLGLLLGLEWAANLLAAGALVLLLAGLRNAFELILWIARQPL